MRNATRGSSRLRRDDQGSTLIAVIGLTAVAAIVVAAVATSTVHSLAFTASSRAEVQSVAAAESGVSIAREQIAKGTNACDVDFSAAAASFAAHGDGDFTAVVEHSIDGNTWLPCPLTAATRFVRVVSDGTASAKGVAGVTSGDESTVVASYDYTPGVGPVAPSGAAIYNEGLFGTDKSELDASVQTEITGGGGVIVRGNYQCTNPNGTLEGSIWVYGEMELGKCKIEGNAHVRDKATLDNGNNVGGDLCSTPRHANRCPPGWTMPPGPTWVDVDYNPALWMHSDNLLFDVAPAPSAATQCKLHSIIVGLPSGTRPTLIDTRAACPNGVELSSNTNMTRDVAMFATKFTLMTNGTSISPSPLTAERRLWLIVPDTVADGFPTCTLPTGEHGFGFPGNGNKSIVIGDRVRAFLYTPCQFHIKNNSVWRGQIYAGGSDMKNNLKFTYAPIGLGGINLNTGVVSPLLPSYTLRAVQDQAGG
jgi:Tfp pilus assembly protein PilX